MSRVLSVSAIIAELVPVHERQRNIASRWFDRPPISRTLPTFDRRSIPFIFLSFLFFFLTLENVSRQSETVRGDIFRSTDKGLTRRVNWQFTRRCFRTSCNFSRDADNDEFTSFLGKLLPRYSIRHSQI